MAPGSAYVLTSWAIASIGNCLASTLAAAAAMKVRRWPRYLLRRFNGFPPHFLLRVTPFFSQCLVALAAGSIACDLPLTEG